MPKIIKQQEQKERQKIELRHYTDSELQKFHTLVQKYYSNYTMVDGEVIRVLDRRKLMISYGAINEKGAVLIDEVEMPPNRLQQFDNVLEQWQYWKIRTGLDEGSWNHNKLKSLDKVAQEMTVETSVEEIPF